MEIKDIPRDEYFRIRYGDLDANIFNDGREFCARSFDSRWCCIGVIVDYRDNLENKNPMLQINDVYKNE